MGQGERIYIKERFQRRQIDDEQLQADDTISDLRALGKKKTRQIQELEEQQQALTNIEQNIQQRETPPETVNVDQ